MVTIASAWGLQASGRGPPLEEPLPAAGSGSAERDCATDVTATTRSPRAFAPRHLDGTAVRPPAEKTIITSRGPNRKFERMTSASPGPLDEHRLALAVRPTTCVWNVMDSSTIGLNPDTTVPREHLLDRDPGVAGPEEVDRPSAAIAWHPMAGGLDPVRLGRRPREDLGRLVEPGRGGGLGHGHAGSRAAPRPG
jgi:hypothetical protein